ncbi:DUF3667 domain-containing protein [Marinihelvus fidelis]|uniref:DUF3667 domain-containing protein n=1 Tax=Marinihelvus fidelis TaxID=2613842 RepID=A0A5N0T898_9GAMM|nr:DUF3667 domain-containing protein [Marinihelvus fidelis]KAA9130938.1 DUF3667 domain-containing protein [Marinihelvus fidelis]
MSETAGELSNAPADPDGHYTLAPSRRAGSADCLNCGTALAGPFCHYCGQPDRRIMRFFPVLLREFLEDFVDFDSRFTRTVKPLLLRPGRLTRDFLEGRRYRYTPPLRLYLFSSILFFLVATALSFVPIQITTNGDDDPVAAIEDNAVVMAEGMAGNITPDAPDPPDEFPNLQFNDRPWDPETNPVAIPLLPQRLNDWINEEIGESPRKARDIADDPRAFVGEVMDLLPGTMFVLLPVFALILKFWYLFARRYYVEHLVLSLHNHAFLFVVMSMVLLLDTISDALGSGAWGSHAASVLGAVMFCWMPVYLLMSLKTVYRQSWPMTLLKGLLVWVTYTVLASTVSLFIALLGFLMF